MPKQTYYITTAIDYPNAPPHIGHAYEKIVSDFLARWHEQNGEDVFFLTGTDEHGQKIARIAQEKGKTPKQYVDEMAEKFKLLAQKLNLRINNFIRTTEKKHIKTATEIWNKVYEKGLIYKGEYKGLYCVGCEAFYTEKDLVEGNCPVHQKPAEQVSEESYFFKLSEFQQQLIQHIEQHQDFIQPESRKNEILNRLKEPLRDLSVSRTTFNWGIPVPQDKKHVIYVWFDALLNYLSGISYPTKKYQKYWPANCHQIGKDISWFHTVIWPAILTAADIPLPKTVYVHGYLTVNGQKMSKSLGNVIDPIYMVDTYGADPVRYVMLREVPAGEDGDFSETTLTSRNNSDLADSLGNLLQRTSVLIQKNFNGQIPTCGTLTDKEKELQKAIPDINKLNELVNNYKWHHAIEQIWNYIARCNKYVNDTEPWKQTDPERLATILYTLVEHLRIISILVYPAIPAAAEKIAAQTGQQKGKFKQAKFTKKTTGHILQPEILFKKIEKTETKPAPAEKSAPDADFSILNLKIGKILKAEPHPNADKLYILQLDAGEPRQLVAGIKAHYKPEELTNKNIIFISNLQPATIRGIESRGMILAGEKDGVVKVIEAEGTPGEQVYVEGITPKTEQITIEQFQKIKITTKNKQAVHNDKPLRTQKGPVTIDLPDGAHIR
ncbi:methionine--tRNA ligase [Candidatus Woesearchaeota archaeon]|nr:methionine--tRNA ligase [Candidatus Woesearchaeota archaeon]MBW3016707.1 methionine--tRNA ligase [Candidatus Woesearchaeota archaeon]